jgi:hypothetical protein
MCLVAGQAIRITVIDLFSQDALIKRLGPNAHPFTMEVTPLAPPSVQLVPAKEYSGAPIGTSYDVRAYAGTSYLHVTRRYARERTERWWGKADRQESQCQCHFYSQSHTVWPGMSPATKPPVPWHWHWHFPSCTSTLLKLLAFSYIIVTAACHSARCDCEG